jgi:phage terminase large subunit-like protein
VDGTEPNLMWSIRERSRGDSPPPAVRYLEYSADPGADPSKLSTWRQANPGVGTLVDPKAIANDYATMPLSRFGQMRLGLWTQHESAWLPVDAWDALEVQPGPPPDGATLTLGFDGSASGDTTALVAYEPATARLAVLGYWERPPGAKAWSVPRPAVTDTVRMAFGRYNVVTMLADPWGWRESLQEWAEEWGEDRVLEWNSAHPARMGPAADAFRTAVMAGELAWDGHQAMRSHILSAVAKVTPAGDVIVKDARHPQYIDLAVAAILAREGAREADLEPMNIY